MNKYDEAGGVNKDEELLKKDTTNENHSDEEQGKDKVVYSEEDYKNAQAFGTKARQWELKALTKLVQQNPSELKNIEDKKALKTILESEFNVSSLDELEIINPNVFKWDNENDNNEDFDDEDDRYSKLEKKIKLMEYKETKGAVQDAINSVKANNSLVVETIPNFEDKLEEEMKYISSDLSPKERVNRAFKILTNSSESSFEAYLSMQGKTIVKSHEDAGTKNSNKDGLMDSPLWKAMFGW